MYSYSRSRSRSRRRRNMYFSQQFTPVTPNRVRSVSRGRSSRRSSVPDVRRNIAATAAGAALGYIAGNVPGAVIGANVGSALAKRTRFSNRVSVAGRKVGKFSRKIKKFKKETVPLRYGYHCTSEVHANFGDEHCVYIGHSTCHYELYVRTLMGAMLRKVLLKAGLSVPNRDQELPFYSQFDSDGFKFVFILQNPITGGANTLEHLVTQDKTLTNVINDWTALRDYLLDLFRGTLGSEPQSMAVYSSDRNALDTNWRLAAQINFRNEKIHWTMHSNLKVQNRTAGALAGAGEEQELDRVDQQPLTGRLYTFKGGEPRLKHTTNWTGAALNDDEKLSRMRQYGSSHTGASGLPQPYQEPPVPKLWMNCIGASKVVLQPGDIKNAKISYSISGKLPNVLKKIKTTYTESGFVKGVSGKCQILALEEYMRTPNNNNIFVGFEREFKIGCWLQTKKSYDVFTSDLTETSITVPDA